MLSGKDPKIINLINALGLPEHCRSFNIDCKADSILTVTCEYYPDLNLDEDGELVTFFKKYKLQEIEE